MDMKNINDSLKRRDFLHMTGSAALALMLPRIWISGRESGSKTSLVSHPIYLEHETGAFHFENPGRLRAILDGLEDSGLFSSLQSIIPQEAAMHWIEKVHQKDYIETVRKDVMSGAHFLSTKSGNTAICPRSFDVALWAVGGALKACDSVMSGEAKNVFCALRPPGHHAAPNRGMGFCLFNNVAIAARYLQEKHNLKKILIVDWDVHHGNGTQDIFYEDGSVFFFSTHQWPWYPWSGSADERGKGQGEGTTLNVPLPAGSGDTEIIEAFEKKLWPQVDQFKPNFVLISAGFDSRNTDPLGRFRVTDAGFKKLTRIMKQMADDHAEGCLVSVLEGGYSLEGLARAVPAHIEELMDS
jgi:acetoin utilization deacetylase AcuC-like enzyme